MSSPLWFQQLNNNGIPTNSFYSYLPNNIYSPALALMAFASGQNETLNALNWRQVFMAQTALANFNSAVQRQQTLPLLPLPTANLPKFNFQPILNSKNFLKHFLNTNEIESKKSEKLKNGIEGVVKSEKTDYSAKILSELLFKNSTEIDNKKNKTTLSPLASTSSSISSSGSCEENIEFKSKRKIKRKCFPVCFEI